MKRVLGLAAAVALGLTVSYPAAAQLNALTRGGLNLTAEDWALLEAAAEKLYATEDQPVGAAETWSNDQSGNSGRIELVMAGDYQGMPCRRLKHDIRVKDVGNPFHFIVDRCQTPDGAWKAR
jgi:surface antigen